jgi:hypothetical protein
MHQIIAVERCEAWLAAAVAARRVERPRAGNERGPVAPRRRRAHGRRISQPLTVRNAR